MKKEKTKIVDICLLIVIGIIIGVFISLLIIEIPKILTCSCENDNPTGIEPCSIYPRDSLSDEEYKWCEDRNWTDLTKEELDARGEAWRIATCPCYKPKN